MRSVLQYLTQECTEKDEQSFRRVESSELPLMNISIQIDDVFLISIFSDTDRENIEDQIRGKKKNLDERKIKAVAQKCIE